jgi:hypothetical protein
MSARANTVDRLREARLAKQLGEGAQTLLGTAPNGRQLRRGGRIHSEG